LIVGIEFNIFRGVADEGGLLPLAVVL